ncbi:MAG: hypothetical protein WDA29_08780 [Flavobacteriaceae bacterium]
MNYSTMNTSMERVYAHTNTPGIVREIWMHYINYYDEAGKKIKTRLEKQIPGKLFRILEPHETLQSRHGIVEYVFPNGEKRRLIPYP